MVRFVFTVEDLAEYFHVPVPTVYAWNSRGIGPKRYRVGKHVRYRRADVDAWLETQAVPAYVCPA